MRTVLITGGNAGIGLETAVALAASGDRLVIACRNEIRAREAIGEIGKRCGSSEVSAVTLDLADLDSVRNCADQVGTRLDRLDLLVNNAGLTLSKRAETVQGLEMTIGVNHFGHFVLTNLLRPLLLSAPGPRIVNVSSAAHRAAIGGLNFDDLNMSKRYSGSWRMPDQSWRTSCSLESLRADGARLTATAYTLAPCGRVLVLMATPQESRPAFSGPTPGLGATACPPRSLLRRGLRLKSGLPGSLLRIWHLVVTT